MRKATNNQYPKFAVWENVRGALSSNKGDDFYEVMQAFASVCEPEISIPRPKKWEKSGWMDGNGWSVAWRLYDAQYWGVPQRRKRIYCIADFRERERERERLEKYFLSPKACQGILNRATKRGKILPPILEEALRQQSRERERESYNIQANCIDRALTAGCNGRGWSTGAMYTLTTMDVHAVSYYVFDNHSQDTRYNGPVKVTQTASATFGMGGNNTPFVVEVTDE